MLNSQLVSVVPEQVPELPFFEIYAFFNETETSEISTLTLHAALPVGAEGLEMS